VLRSGGGIGGGGGGTRKNPKRKNPTEYGCVFARFSSAAVLDPTGLSAARAHSV